MTNQKVTQWFQPCLANCRVLRRNHGKSVWNKRFKQWISYMFCDCIDSITTELLQKRSFICSTETYHVVTILKDFFWGTTLKTANQTTPQTPRLKLPLLFWSTQNPLGIATKHASSCSDVKSEAFRTKIGLGFWFRLPFRSIFVATFKKNRMIFQFVGVQNVNIFETKNHLEMGFP